MMNKAKARMAMAMMLAAMMVGSSVGVFAEAQWGQWGRNDRYRRYDKHEVRQIGRQNGYHMGVREGRYDAQRRSRMDFKSSRVYRDAMAGYRSEFGFQNDYRKGFREGFEQGYRNSYRNPGNGRWDNRNDPRGWGRNDDWNVPRRRY
jgi:hypothetical protein